MTGERSTTEHGKASCRVLVALTTTQGSIPRKNMSSSGVTILTTKTTRYVCGISCGKKAIPAAIKSMLRVIRRMNLEVSPDKRKEYKPKPYAKAEYPGQKMQVDVKYVPTSCVVNGKKYYQYTAVDECARWCFREMYEEHSTASSLDFMKKLIHCCPFPIREVQTDNGTEWTKALLTNDPTKKTCFELFLEECGIRYHRIRVATPRHNGKVERQHRLDGERFYSKLRMYSLADGRKQLAAYNKLSNTIPKCCLGFRSPNDVLSDYIHLF